MMNRSRRAVTRPVGYHPSGSWQKENSMIREVRPDLRLVCLVLFGFGCSANPNEGPGFPEQTPDSDSDCDAGEVWDGRACVPEACGPGLWGDVEIRDGDLFVAESGEDDDEADGTEEHPFGHPEEAVDVLYEADSGGRIVISSGRWDGLFELGELPGPLEFRGRCPELVEFASEDGSIVEVTESDVTLSGISLLGGNPALLVSGEDFAESTLVVLRDVAILNSPGVGIQVSGLGRVEASDVVIRGVQGGEDLEGLGILVEEGSTFFGLRLAVSEVQGVGLFAEGEGAVLEVEDSTVIGGLPYEDGFGGFGAQMDTGARLVARGVLFEGNSEFGVFLEGEGTTADLEDVTIRGTAPNVDGEHGFGLFIEHGPELVAVGLTLDGNLEANLYMDDATAEISDSRIVGALPRLDGEGGGYGVDVHGGTALVLTGVVLEDNSDLGMLFEASSGELNDVVIRDTHPRDDGTFGEGIVVQEGGSLVASDLVLDGNGTHGLFITGAGTTAVLTDVTIQNQLSALPGEGTGIVVLDGAEVTATRLVADSLGGPGMLIAGDASLACTDCTVEEATFAAALLYDGTLTLDGGSLTDTAPGEDGGGVGVAALDDRGAGTLSMSGTQLSGHPHSGLYLTQPGGAFDLDGLSVTGDGAAGGSAFGLMALDGVTRWTPTSGPGLLVSGSAFSDFATHAMVLHDSSLSLDADTFTGVGGFDVWFQACTTATPEILSGTVNVSDCSGPAVDVAPRLTRLLDYEQLGN
jgi:hypothetical protein